MDIFDLLGIESENDKEKTSKIVKKIKEPKELAGNKAITSKKLSKKEKVELIKQNVINILGKHLDDSFVVKTKEEFVDYVDTSIENNLIVIDTETNNSLDPLTCKIMGLCLYTPGKNQCYVPVNHRDVDTDLRLEWQLTENDLNEQLQRLVDNNVKIIYHNAKFDYQVLKCTCGVELPIYWDTMIGARLLNENESAGLKEQYVLHIDSEQEKYSIEKLFEKEEYAIFAPELFSLYASTDALMTYKLYEYQVNLFNQEENKGVYKLFRDVEMPCIKVVAEMELTGIAIDLEYCERLSNKYHNQLDELNEQINKELDGLKDKINKWKLTPEANEKKISGDKVSKSKAEQLEDPINLGSPTQLAILLYDVLKIEPVDKLKPRGTGKEELTKIYDKTGLELCNLLLEHKKLSKLIEAFLDTLPKKVNEKTGRIHCTFRQIGADTGRFSCTEPNLQQIPSKNNEIRLMFKAQDGYVLVGSDFSQQEPRLLSNYSRDDNMVKAYQEGKDLYSMIASKVYHNKYEDNLEHFEDGSINEDGKKRRSSVKSLLLGIMYGMGTASIAKNIKGTYQEAKDILDGFYTEFPKVKKWIDKTEEDGKKVGYVEDWYGRRRRLPNLLLQPYVIQYKDSSKNSTSFNPFLYCKDLELEDTKIKKYRKLCENIKTPKDYDEIKQKADRDGISIHSNTTLIAEAERQCVNARIQGGAATMTKVAMIKLYNDKELNDLGFKMLIGVHDELIGECPKENADKVADRLTYIMMTCIEDYCIVPFKCDAEISEHWYEDVYSSSIRKEYSKLKDKCDNPFAELCKNHKESSENFLERVINE